MEKQLKHTELKYKNKVVGICASGNSCPAGRGGVESIMGMQSKKCCISLDGKSDLILSNELYLFYNRLNVYDFSDELSAFKNVALIQFNSVHVDRSEVQALNRSVNIRESPGPDWHKGSLTAKKMCSTACRYFHFHFIFTVTPAPAGSSSLQWFNYYTSSKKQSSRITQQLQTCGTYISYKVFWKDCKECSSMKF